MDNMFLIITMLSTIVVTLLIYSAKLRQVCNRIEKINERLGMTHLLVATNTTITEVTRDKVLDEIEKIRTDVKDVPLMTKKELRTELKAIPRQVTAEFKNELYKLAPIKVVVMEEE